MTHETSAPAREYLAERLDGARDLYLVALAFGERRDGASAFGRMIREARIHFASVIEETRAAGLDTEAIAAMLAEQNVGASIRPELRERVEQLLVESGGRRPSRAEQQPNPMTAAT